MTQLGGLSWEEAAAKSRASVLVIPLGSTEQHGAHLPLSTDTLIIEALCGELARVRPDHVLLAPAIDIGASDEHAGFTGTLSVGTGALTASLVRLARSAEDFAAVLFVTVHGGNVPAMKQARQELANGTQRVWWWWPGPATARLKRGGDLHAGWAETSLMLYIAPELVHPERGAPGGTKSGDRLVETLMNRGVAAISANGVIGDPSGADAKAGRDLFEALSRDLLRAFDAMEARA